MLMEEQELAIRCARRDRQAREELFRRYSPRLFAVQGGIRYPEPTLQWSCGLFVDAGIRLGSFATLYMQPSLSYYFTKTVLMTYRTENPLSFTLQAGFRFNL